MGKQRSNKGDKEPSVPTALSSIRICDFSGILAGAGATKFLAAFGVDVIRVEDPIREGRWDVVRGNPPFKDERRGIDLGGGFNNHNVGKRGVTINLKHPKGLKLAKDLISLSDVVHENFAPGVMDRLGLSYEDMKSCKADIIYVSNSGFGHSGTYSRFKSFGPIAQAASGLSYTSGINDMEPAGWGYSYLDHTGAYYGAMAILLAIRHRNRTGEGQYVDIAASETGAVLHGPAILDHTVNNRTMREEGRIHANRSIWPPRAPHGIYPAAGNDEWVAIACEDDLQWEHLAEIINEPWTKKYSLLTDRINQQDELDSALSDWTQSQSKFTIANQLSNQNIPCAPVRTPRERIDEDPTTKEFGLWPNIHHTEIGATRVDGIPVHLSETDWSMSDGAPCLGEHNDEVLSEVLQLSSEKIADLKKEGAI